MRRFEEACFFIICLVLVAMFLIIVLGDPWPSVHERLLDLEVKVDRLEAIVDEYH